MTIRTIKIKIMMMTLTKMKNMMVMMLTRMTMIKCDKMKMIKIMFSNLKKNALVPLPKISFIQIYDTKQQIIQDLNILITLPIEYFLPNKLFNKRIYFVYDSSHTWEI